MVVPVENTPGRRGLCAETAGPQKGNLHSWLEGFVKKHSGWSGSDEGRGSELEGTPLRRKILRGPASFGGEGETDGSRRENHTENR